MDLVRARAIPALILGCGPALAAAADCASLNGTYREEAAAVAGAEPQYLSNLTMDRGRTKLFRVESPGSKPGGLAPSAPLQRPKVAHLAVKGTLTYAPKKSRVRFEDAQGMVLAELGIDGFDPWDCVDGRLLRKSERTSGLGDAVRTERIQETLERNAAGELVYRETRSFVDGPAAKPRVTEARFPAAR
jgi:hypothetical protein